MTPVLHVAQGVWAVRPPILPIEGQKCPERKCRDGSGFYMAEHGAIGVCDHDAFPPVLPPVLSGRIAVAVDGAIIGTATATGVLPVVGPNPGDYYRQPRPFVQIHPAWPALWHRSDTFGEKGRRDFDLTPYFAALGLSPGQWVVTIEDWAPAERCPFGHDDPAIFRAEDIDSDAPLDGTRLAADIAATVPEANRDLRRAEWRAELKARTRARRKCRFCMFGEPVPVATAPVGTITTWEAG